VPVSLLVAPAPVASVPLVEPVAPVVEPPEALPLEDPPVPLDAPVEPDSPPDELDEPDIPLDEPEPLDIPLLRLVAALPVPAELRAPLSLVPDCEALEPVVPPVVPPELPLPELCAYAAPSARDIAPAETAIIHLFICYLSIDVKRHGAAFCPRASLLTRREPRHAFV
jgi:hypothetical protein